MLKRGLMMLATGVALVAVGVAVVWWSVAAYAADPRDLNSNSGMLVFLAPDGETASSYPLFTPGLTPAVLMMGVLVVVAALFHLAIFRGRSRES
jgi:hypothetical protein